MLATLAFVVAMVLQILLLLYGFIAMGLGGATGAQAMLFFGVAGAVLLATLLGLVLVRRKRVAASAGWAVFAVPVIDAVLVATLAHTYAS